MAVVVAVARTDACVRLGETRLIIIIVVVGWLVGWLITV